MKHIYLHYLAAIDRFVLNTQNGPVSSQVNLRNQLRLIGVKATCGILRTMDRIEVLLPNA